MHPLIDSATVQTIRNTGKTDRTLPDRIPVLEQYGLPYDRPAQNVVITGCQILSALPGVLADLALLFERKGLSYTFLSREFCCGNYLYRPAIQARDEEALAEVRQLSREFLSHNITQARDLGASRIIIFCSPCYPIYKHAFPDVDIVFYPKVIGEGLDEHLSCSGSIDYYAGCYRLHRKLAPVSMDLQSTDDVLNSIKGLQINRISAPRCCFTPDGLKHMIDHIRTDTMVHICTGCYQQALANRPDRPSLKILMLPEFIRTVCGQR